MTISRSKWHLAAQGVRNRICCCLYGSLGTQEEARYCRKRLVAKHGLKTHLLNIACFNEELIYREEEEALKKKWAIPVFVNGRMVDVPSQPPQMQLVINSIARFCWCVFNPLLNQENSGD